MLSIYRLRRSIISLNLRFVFQVTAKIAQIVQCSSDFCTNFCLYDRVFAQKQHSFDPVCTSTTERVNPP